MIDLMRHFALMKIHRILLAVAAIIDHEIVGMAGASADSPYFWQIGINVNKEFEGRHIASGLVSILKRDIMEKRYCAILRNKLFQILHHNMLLQRQDLKLRGVELITEKNRMI